MVKPSSSTVWSLLTTRSISKVVCCLLRWICEITDGPEGFEITCDSCGDLATERQISPLCLSSLLFSWWKGPESLCRSCVWLPVSLNWRGWSAAKHQNRPGYVSPVEMSPPLGHFWKALRCYWDRSHWLGWLPFTIAGTLELYGAKSRTKVL